MLINIFIYIKCEENKNTKIIIHKNGEIETEIIGNKNNKLPTSIYYNESFIIYNYFNDNDSDINNTHCMYYYNYSNSNNNSTSYNLDDAISQSSCSTKTPLDEDNICCYYRQKSNITENKYG